MKREQEEEKVKIKGSGIKRLGKLFSRFSYLVRLSVIVLFALTTPLMALQYITVSRSYEELETANHASYEASGKYFADYFWRMLDNTQTVANRIHCEHIFNKSVMFENNWYMYEATQALLGYLYQIPEAERMILYVRNTDQMITSDFVYTKKRYAAYYLPTGEKALYELLEDESLWKGNRLKLLSTFDSTDSGKARLLICKPLRISENIENDAVLITEMSASSVAGGFLGQLTNGTVQLAVYDGDTLLYCSDGYRHGFIPPQETGATSVIDYGDSAFCVREQGGLLFVVQMSGDAYAQRMGSTSRTLLRTLLLYTVLSLVLCSTAIYFIYQPVRRVVRSIGVSEDEGGELGTIEHVIGEIRQEYSQMSGTLTKTTEKLERERRQLMRYVLRVIAYPAQEEKEQRLPASDVLDLAAAADDILGEKLGRLLLLTTGDVGCVEVIQSELEALCGPGIDIYGMSDAGKYLLFAVGTEEEALEKLPALVKRLYGSAPVCGGLLRMGCVGCVRLLRQAYLELYTCSDEAALGERVLAYTNAHYKDSSLSLTGIADACGCSPYQVSRCFKERSGVGFKDYIASRRLKCAKEMLVISDYTIADIAQKAGFENATYFMTWFKANMQESPTAFRKRMRAGEGNRSFANDK
ncbi:MAG: helix-turn-helix transcriptional regulator [Clostridiaceae bacterium]|nr:helix-turn-helix transcriptional regulator [Clostridiaceae bacterium]